MPSVLLVIGPLGPVHYITTAAHPFVGSGKVLSGHNYGQPSLAGKVPSRHFGEIAGQPVGVGLLPSGHAAGHPLGKSLPSGHFLKAGEHPEFVGLLLSGQSDGQPEAVTEVPSGQFGKLLSVGQSTLGLL